MNKPNTFEQIERHAMFGGWQEVWAHDSITVQCRMKFGVYLPPQATHQPLPVLYFLSGLTANEQNVIIKSNIQRFAALHGIIIITPDTSPRGTDIADDPDYDLGQGAGFYLNATRNPWKTHFQMEDYIVKELPSLIRSHFPANNHQSIAGHSMGGHGALTLALRHPGYYQSVSAFAPISSPSRCAWGEKAFLAYLGPDRQNWHNHDAIELINCGKSLPPLLVDQGLSDPYLDHQLLTSKLEETCKAKGLNATIRYHPHYDHSYYFISSFIEDHLAFHHRYLNKD